MTPAVARLLHALHTVAPDGVTARIHVADLAAATGLQVRRVQQLARDAEARGLLSITTQAGRGHANTYLLTAAGLEMVQPAPEMVQRRVPPRTTEEAAPAPVAPFTREKVQSAPEMVQRNGASHREKGQSNGAKKVQRGAMNDSYPEDSKSLSLKRTTQTLPGESHSLAALAPFPAEADFTLSSNGDAPLTSGALPRLLVARGFEGANVQTLARIARDEGADTSDVLKAMVWGERQETRGRVSNWHAYLVACVKRDGWKACAAFADAPDPLPRHGGHSRPSQPTALDVAAGIDQLWRDMGLDPADMEDRSPNGHR